jgi:hypothetical protein
VASEQDCTDPDGALTLFEDGDGYWIEGGCVCNSDRFEDLWSEFSLEMVVK